MINIGILGCGWIAEAMASTLQKMDNVCSYAASSRDIKKANSFVEKFNMVKAYGSYEEMVKDPNIHLIYIATPHSHHYKHATLCLNNNKHVLCEKAFMVNEIEVKDIISLAKSKNLLIVEAMWTRFTPLAKELKNCLNLIGDIKNIEADLFLDIAHVERLYNPNLAGGVTLDLGVYAISFLNLVTSNKILSIESKAELFDTGVDKFMYIDIKLENIDAKLSCGCNSYKNQGLILGTKGSIKVSNITNFEEIEVYDLNKNIIKTIKKENQITGYEYQVLECIDAIENNKLEVVSMTHQDSINLIKICDEVRKQNNIKYPFE